MSAFTQRYTWGVNTDQVTLISTVTQYVVKIYKRERVRLVCMCPHFNLFLFCISHMGRTHTLSKSIFNDANQSLVIGQ